MLVFTRDENETIVIDGNIVVTILGVRHGTKVKVGIDAPRSIAVHRGEVQDEIDAGRGHAPRAH